VRISILITAAALLFFSMDAQALSVRRMSQDVKLPSQGVVEQQAFTNLIVATTNLVLATNAGPTAATALAVTTFTAQPDSPRNLTITPTGTTTDVEACVVTVAGTNFFGKAITETFTFLANASTAVTGAKAFASVTSASFPANCESGAFAATWTIGVGEKIGLKRCMAEAGAFIQSSIDGAKETTLATVVADSDEVEKNTVDFNGTMDAASDFKAYFIQNFGCFP